MRRFPLLLAAMASVFAAVSSSALATAGRTAASPTNSSPPTITGTDRSGQTLTATNGSWAGGTPINNVAGPQGSVTSYQPRAPQSSAPRAVRPLQV
jgi:hypothetical protein